MPKNRQDSWKSQVNIGVLFIIGSSFGKHIFQHIHRFGFEFLRSQSQIQENHLQQWTQIFVLLQKEKSLKRFIGRLKNDLHHIENQLNLSLKLMLVLYCLKLIHQCV